MKSPLLLTLCAGTALLATTALASAAQSTTSVNVRSGPGTSYGVVDVLYAGENVTVEGCVSSGWCQITHSGPDGWVSARYLTGNADDDQVIIDDDEDSSPNVQLQFGFGFGSGYPYGFPWGNGGGNGNGGNMGNGNLVCLVTFFQRNQVEGGADANVQSAQLMTQAQAEAFDRPNDRRRIFDYGTNQQTRQTCRYLDQLN